VRFRLGRVVAMRPRVGLDDPHRLVGVISEPEQVDILLVDRGLGQQRPADPIDHPAPVLRPHQDHGEVLDLVRLDERQRLEKLVERAVAAREDHEGIGVLHEHDLAGEEVPELDPEVDVAVEPLLPRQLDVAADR
jgi:hypothetical protein